MSRETAHRFPSSMAFAMFGPFALWLPLMQAAGAGLRVPTGGFGMVRVGARKGVQE
ncbi:hypothetical protein [Gemmobacter sp.]|uniref:hypothetical protein n=1 Tax=Gemmobacter sp. TaxID=1898957 RepID=UPI002AFE05A3|nr:hypothetical protein [Gemmobacter sp.]